MTNQWIQVRRKDPGRDSGSPLITLRGKDAAFNAEFTRQASVSKYKEVKLAIEPNSRRIAFKFLTGHDPDAYTIHGDGGSSPSRASGRVISSTEIFMNIPWIRAVSMNPDSLKRRFRPEWDNIQGAWVITLMPMFEKKVGRLEVPSGSKGIYRYVRHNGDVVYIGKGNIKDRLLSPERSSWDFDYVEYSEIEDSNEQYKWEKWWIDDYEQDKGELPIYNRIGGRRIIEE